MHGHLKVKKDTQLFPINVRQQMLVTEKTRSFISPLINTSEKLN